MIALLDGGRIGEKRGQILVGQLAMLGPELALDGYEFTRVQFRDEIDAEVRPIPAHPRFALGPIAETPDLAHFVFGEGWEHLAHQRLEARALFTLRQRGLANSADGLPDRFRISCAEVVPRAGRQLKLALILHKACSSRPAFPMPASASCQ